MKKVIIVGAGIAGLTASIYAQRSGFDVTLIEQHNKVGGMCTSWRRKGYLFEGAVHWMTGSSEKAMINRVWKETGALGENVRVLLSDPFRSVEHEGQVLNFFRDIDKTVAHLSDISPEDRPRLQQLAKDVKKMSKMQLPVFDVVGVRAENPAKMTFGYFATLISLLPTFSRIGKMSSEEYMEQFSHPGIRRLLKIAPEGFDASSLLFTLGTLHSGDGGYPEGGSLPMVDRMAKTFTDLGGTLRLKTKVRRVIINNGAATGVELENETLEADAVIVAQETIAALDNLFSKPLSEEWLTDLQRSTKFAVCTFACVGIRAEIPKTPAWKLNEPIRFAGRTIDELDFNNYAGHEGYAPKGCTALTTIFMGDTYDFWKQAKAEGRYEQEKESLSEQINREITQKYPQAEGKIEIIDIATPLTYERYTGARRGSWMSVKKAGDKMKQYAGIMKSVKGLYFAGHRLMTPGGLPVALVSGRTAAQLVCKQFDVMFR